MCALFGRGFLLLALSTLLFVSSGRCDAESESSDNSSSKVIQLTEANYDEVINNTPLILVEFYAPWYVYMQLAQKEAYLLHALTNDL